MLDEDVTAAEKLQALLSYFLLTVSDFLGSFATSRKLKWIQSVEVKPFQGMHRAQDHQLKLMRSPSRHKPSQANPWKRTRIDQPESAHVMPGTILQLHLEK